MTQQAEHPRWQFGPPATEQRRDDAEAVNRQLRLVTTQLTVGPYARFAKPVLDWLGGVLLSIATLPLVALIVPAIWITIGRPAIFTQRRVGRYGTIFTLYKFRTMAADRRHNHVNWSGEERRECHKSPDDPRHTRFGRFLRKWSLDEVPQFWNVALGQMSLVGPRPELEEIVQTKYEPWQHQRHMVKPGVTGAWQISARSNGELMYECTQLDLEYVQRISLLGDLRILLLTLPAALGLRPGS